MKPTLLNKDFEIISTNGGRENENVSVENILVPGGLPYCTKKESNIIVRLQYKGKSGEFTLSNFVVRGGEQCSSPLKDALLFVSSNPLKDSDLEPYYDFTEKKFEKLEHKSETEPILFISCDPSIKEFESQIWKTGKYLSLLFLNSQEETDGSNIDIQHIGIVGFDGKQDSFDCPSIDVSFGVTFPQYDDFNELLDIFSDEFDAYPSLIVFSKDENILKTVEQVSKIFGQKEDEDMNFFHSSRTVHVHGDHCHHDHEEQASQLSVFISEFFSISKLPYMVYITPNLEKRVKFEGEYTTENIIQFINEAKSGKLKNFMRSGVRLEGDKHPRLPGLVHVVQSTFDEIITNTTTDFLLVAHANYQFDPTIFFVISDILKDIKTFKIGVFDIAENDMEINVKTSPTIFLFGKDRKNPLQYKKDKINIHLLDIIAEHIQEKFDVQEKKKTFEERKKLFDLIFESRKQINEVKKASQLVKDYPKDETEEIQKSIKALDDLLSLDTSMIELKKLSDLHHDLEKLTKNLFVFAHKAQLKNVISIHNKEDYQKEYEKAKEKLIVIDWTASWCGPCQFIAPFFVQYSEEYKDVAFLKIDVDECEELARDAQIFSMPTFHFHKGGKKIDELGGADPKGLKEKIETNK